MLHHVSDIASSRRLVPVFVLILLLAGACERERIVDPGPDVTAPLPPADLLVEAARDGTIFFSWIRNREIHPRGYIVYRAEDGAPAQFAPIDTVVEFYYIDEQRSYDTSYTYYVTAIDESGNESGPSLSVTARAANVYEPEAPESFQLNGVNDGTKRLMQLSWAPVDEGDLAGYRIYRSDIPFDAADPALLLAASEAAFFDDSSLPPPDRRWFYGVTAVDHGGLESDLSPVRSDIIASRPDLVSPVNDGFAPSYPLFRWKRVSEASGYLLTVALTESSGEVWSGSAPQSSADTLSLRYGGPALVNGQTYYWRVSSVTSANGKPNGVSGAWRFQVRD